MSDCKHAAITAWVFTEDNEPAGMWSCRDCGRKFEPLDLDQWRDALRYRYLRNRNPRDVFDRSGPEAGCWIDCEAPGGPDEYALTLLTENDADAAIDAAMKESK